MKKLIYKSCFIFLYVINGYAQQEKVNANNQVEVVYEYSHSLSEQIAFDVLLYCTASKSQYIYDSKRKKST
ncbi:hypothetical protein K5I29_06255 [Flavobacterium agricola]|uniref:GLPGLI family protein n=1 Tax=Flavobacterium agricola TaxID=2870839 RepID=A0ABY6M584_9FLAO|nr:hypothetical protein [Flavobacterium agricola]UYW02483.1 hypothetical protein K5I29_06255 [Flavobacterium agricola]